MVAAEGRAVHIRVFAPSVSPEVERDVNFHWLSISKECCIESRRVSGSLYNFQAESIRKPWTGLHHSLEVSIQPSSAMLESIMR